MRNVLLGGIESIIYPERSISGKSTGVVKWGALAIYMHMMAIEFRHPDVTLRVIVIMSTGCLIYTFFKNSICMGLMMTGSKAPRWFI